jgi:hypothetical protein
MSNYKTAKLKRNGYQLFGNISISACQQAVIKRLKRKLDAKDIRH